MLISLQYLRALAAMLVVIQHTQVKGNQYMSDPLSFFHIGHAGVDLFFVISGFIMCYTMEKKSLRFSEFMAHRFQRILPLYWVLTAAAFVAYLVAPQLVNAGGGNTVILQSFLLIPTEDKYLIKNGWTLCYEFFFYILFALPLLLSTLTHKRLSTAGIIFLMVGMGTLLPEDSSYVLTFATAPLLLEFVMGMFAFYYYDKFKHPAIITAFIALSVASLFYANSLGFANPRILYYGLPCMILIIALLNLEPYFKKHQNHFVSKSMKLIGDASYSLYLIHPFALVLSAKVMQKLHFIGGAPLFVSVLIISSTLAGVLCYLLVEKPLNTQVKKIFNGKK